MLRKQPGSGQSQTASDAEAWRKGRWGRNLLTLGYVLVGTWAVGGAIATGIHLGTVQWMEREAQRFFFRAKGTVAPPEQIVILTIDQDSLARGEDYQADPIGNPEFEPIQSWPWQRSVYAQVIDKLMAAGARSVSIDVVLADPSIYGPEDDQPLRRALVTYPGRIVLAANYALFGDPQTGEQLQLELPNPEFQAPFASLGVINFPLDPDGRVYQLGDSFIQQVNRSQPVGEEAGGESIPSFAVATLRAAQLPVPSRVTGNIFYYGPPTTFPRVSFWNVLDPTTWDYHLQQETFKDKIVLIGPLSAELTDFVPTPMSQEMPGIEIHANAIATLLDDRVINEAIPNPPLKGLAIFLGVTGSGLALILLLKKPVSQLLGAFSMAAAWGIISYASFAAGVILPTAVPILAILLSGLSLLTTGAIYNQLEQRRLRQTLERYVAAPIVQEILTHHSLDFQNLLKGRRVKAAVLFCDIRSFTTFSLSVEPEELVEQLNSYLNAMVEAILEAGGTVDKFIGDAIMAEFGSPISQGEKTDALNAIRAALGMRQALRELQQVWAQQGKPILFNGVGINFGEAIAGDIGSSRRREYALIGDAVNIASRVEGLTRQFWTDILITQSLYEQVQDEVEVVCVGKHSLKGRGENQVMLYSLVGWKGEDPTPYRVLHEKLRNFKEFKDIATDAKLQ